MITRDEFLVWKRVQREAEKLAMRWIKAWPSGNGYSSTGRVEIFDDTISFWANPSCSGIGWQQSISTKYLFNDSTLEQDSQLWYENYIKERDDKFKAKQELENHPKVKEYLAMNKPNNVYATFGNPYLSF